MRSSNIDIKKWEWFRYDEIFNIESFHGDTLQDCNKGVIPYISASRVNNGVNGFVDNENYVSGGKITVARNGSVGSSFYQPNRFYPSPDDVRVYSLRERPLNEYIGLFLCVLIEKERYRFAYGRKFGTKRMKQSRMLLPAIAKHKPDWDWIERYAKEKLLPILPTTAKLVWEKNYDVQPINETKYQLLNREWKTFRYDEIFKIEKGFYNKKPEHIEGGEIPFIGATDSNNGITSRCTLEQIEQTTKTGDEKNAPLEEKLFRGNCITVSNNGSVGYAFYQPVEFTCTHDVNPLYIHPQWGIALNPYIAMFLCTVIEKDRFRWAYGRKWRPKRMPSSIIQLPVITGTRIPDWQFMENYIKSLPYSKNI